jgi:hypothetical protein
MILARLIRRFVGAIAQRSITAELYLQEAGFDVDAARLDYVRSESLEADAHHAVWGRRR